MKTPQRILAGLAIEDESLTPGSIAALRQAAWLARGVGAELSLLHSTYDDARAEAGPTPPDELLDEALGIAAHHGLEAKIEIVDDHAWLALVRRALRGAADLLVVGRHNSGMHELGSVAAQCLRASPAPVWAVHADAPVPPRRILVATDLSPAADAATALALTVANHARADLRVLHAWQMPLAAQLTASGASAAAVEDARKSVEAKALAHVRATLAEEDGARTEVRVVRDAPWRAIVRAVDDQETDLVALASVSRGGVPGVLVGNTAERLLRKLTVSVLAVKPADFVCPVAR